MLVENTIKYTLHLSPLDRLQLWREAQPEPISVEGLHSHVMRLHSTFLAGLAAAGHPTVNSSTLLPPQVRGAEAGGRPGAALLTMVLKLPVHSISGPISSSNNVNLALCPLLCRTKPAAPTPSSFACPARPRLARRCKLWLPAACKWTAAKATYASALGPTTACTT